MREIPAGTILWKKAYVTGPDSYDVSTCIVELEVLEPGIEADHDHGCYDVNLLKKCRVRAALIKSIVNNDGEPLEEAWSLYDRRFRYAVGETVRPRDTFLEVNQACGSGIHGFEDRQTAEYY